MSNTFLEMAAQSGDWKPSGLADRLTPHGVGVMAENCPPLPAEQTKWLAFLLGIISSGALSSIRTLKVKLTGVQHTETILGKDTLQKTSECNSSSICPKFQPSCCRNK